MLLVVVLCMQFMQAIILATLAFRLTPGDKSSRCILLLCILGAYGFVGSSILIAPQIAYKLHSGKDTISRRVMRPTRSYSS